MRGVHQWVRPGGGGLPEKPGGEGDLLKRRGEYPWSLRDCLLKRGLAAVPQQLPASLRNNRHAADTTGKEVYGTVTVALPSVKETALPGVLGIRIRNRIRIRRIRMFLGLSDPDPLVRGADPDPDPSLFS
jgi:hypothetical protein